MAPIPGTEFNVNEADREWVEARLVPMSIACCVERIRLSGKQARIGKRTYVYATEWGPSPFAQFYQRVKDDPAWTVVTAATGHDVMIDDPQHCARILLDAI